ncbi:hypothetical protein LCGC14_2307560 [marine sediment metagenome]|uniref:Uncharacterized protein n=1 Tax=marine sediment metagenome TaxID=412755 RepID=A0A0F9D945_9ZZZZ
MKTKLLLILIALLFSINTGWAIGDVDRTEDKVEVNTAAIGVNDAIVDSINAHKVWNIKTSAAAWKATGGPVTVATSVISGTGVWRIEALGAVNVAGNDGTATDMSFAIGQFGGAAVDMSLVGAIASDAAGSWYSCVMDTAIAIIQVAANTPSWASTNSRDAAYRDAGEIYIGNCRFYTPPGSWVISDSTDASNAGTRYLYMRATPMSAGGTLTAN